MAILLLLIIGLLKAEGSIEITQHPQTIHDAIVGDTVVFECGYTGTSTYPKWNINGTEYRITALPQYHRYTAEGLEVHPVTLSMNNTMYSCFFSYSGEREESNSAYLFVRTSSPTEEQTTVVSSFKSEAITHHLPIQTFRTSHTLHAPVTTSNRISTSTPTFNTLPESNNVLVVSTTKPINFIPATLHTLPPSSVYDTGNGGERMQRNLGTIVGVSAGLAAVMTLSITMLLSLFAFIKGRKGGQKTLDAEHVYDEVDDAVKMRIVRNTAYEERNFKPIMTKRNECYATPEVK